jgi:hypothetical protein
MKILGQIRACVSAANDIDLFGCHLCRQRMDVTRGNLLLDQYMNEIATSQLAERIPV